MTNRSQPLFIQGWLFLLKTVILNLLNTIGDSSMIKKEKLYPMNNTVNEIVREITDDPKKQQAKKQKIKRSTTKQLRKEGKDINKDY